MFMPASVPGAMPPSAPQAPMGVAPGLLGLLSPQNLFSIGAMQGLAPIRPPQPIPTPPVQRMPMPQAGAPFYPSSGMAGLGPMGPMGGMSANPFAVPGMIPGLPAGGMPGGSPTLAGMQTMSMPMPGTAAPRMPTMQTLMDTTMLDARPGRY